MIYWVSYLIIKLIAMLYLRMSFAGLKNLPAKGGFIIASNHISNLDPFLLGLSRWRQFSYMAKDSLFKKPLVSFFFRAVNAFPVKRDAADVGAVKEALKRLKGGCPLILFPEGTRGSGDRSKKPNPGIGLIAAKSQVPVIPAYIEGADKALPPGKKILRPYPVKITFGPPVKISKNQSREETAEIILGQIYSLKQGKSRV